MHCLQVVLKDRSEIGKLGQEDTYYDDTVFTPISPDEVSSLLPSISIAGVSRDAGVSTVGELR